MKKKLIYQSMEELVDSVSTPIEREIERCKINCDLFLDALYSVTHAKYSDAKICSVFMESDVNYGVGVLVSSWFTVVFEEYKDKLSDGTGINEMENIVCMMETYYSRMNTMFGERFIPQSDNYPLNLTMKQFDEIKNKDNDELVDYEKMRLQKLYVMHETLPNLPDMKNTPPMLPSYKPNTNDFISSDMIVDNTEYSEIDSVFNKWCHYLNDNLSIISNNLPKMVERFGRSIMSSCPSSSIEEVWIDITDKVNIELGIKITNLPYNPSMTELREAKKKVDKMINVPSHINMFPKGCIEYMDDDSTVYITMLSFKSNKFLIKKLFKNGGQESLFA